MKYVSAFVSFGFVFVGVFFLAGWSLMPYLPPVPDHPVTVFEGEYWGNNWVGCLLGLSARSVLKKASREEERNAKTDTEPVAGPNSR